MTGRSGEAAEQGGDWARFLAAFLRRPTKMGAVAPSSRIYCATMVEHAATGVDGPILELGPGLGVVTRALLDHGVPPSRITSIEYDPGFAETLQRRFPRVTVVNGDGFDLDRTLASRRTERFAAILLAIPILNLSQSARQALFTDYIGRLRPGGNLTQLSYLPVAPVKPVPGVFSVSSTKIVWANIPPARVWIYTPEAGSSSAAAAPPATERGA